MLKINNSTVLVIAPHTDDAEFGCGGTIAKLIEEENDVYCAAFSACQQSVIKGLPPDILVKEVKAASKVLGVKNENLFLYDFEVRTFNYRRQEILDCILDLKTKLKPDFIFIPSTNDVHQDHYTIAQEALRAFKFNNLLCYELPWNNLTFNTSSFCSLDEKQLNKKIEAVKQYQSQKHRPYSNEEFIRSLAKVRGVQINTMYAECFEVLRIKF